MAESCIFCRIAGGEGPAHVLDEDEHTIAFLDINPWTRGHSLVIPRRHARNVFDIDDEDLGRVAAAGRRLALRLRERLGCDGVNLLQSNEAPAWQTVFHFHLHVIPRYDGDPLRLPGQPAGADHDELAALAREVRDGS